MLSVNVALEIVKLAGVVTEVDITKPVVDAIVSLEVRNPYGGTVHIARTSTDRKGEFSDLFGLLAESPAGTYSIYVTASKDGFEDARTVAAFEVAAADWSLTLSQTEVTVARDSSTDVQVSVNAVAGFRDRVLLNLTGFPSGVTYRLSPQIIAPNSTAILQIRVGPDAPTGTYLIRVQGTAGGKTRSVFLTFMIVAPSFSWIVVLAAVSAMAVIAVVLRRLMRSWHTAERGPSTEYLAATRALVKLEEMKALGQISEEQYLAVKKEYEERIRRSLGRAKA